MSYTVDLPNTADLVTDQKAAVLESGGKVSYI